MSQFDWEFVGSVLLERERRPVLVLDPAGRIVRANRALLFFVEEGTRTHLVKFVDDWVLPDSRPAFLEAWTRAMAGERPRVSVALAPTAFHLEPVFELVPLKQDGLVRSVMMVMVDAVASGLSVPLLPSLGLLYEVSLDGDGRPERLLRALSPDRLHKVDTSVPCYRGLLGKDRACASCPVPGLSKENPSTAIRLESHSPFKAQLLSARRVRDDVASVNVVPVDQSIYSSLVQARIEALGVRAKLTERERHVLALLLMGRTLDDVASAEGISARTAKYHQQNLLRKLGAESRTDLFRLLS
ncbi:MAG: LuxR C-terminal-related transcriptional regulator [Archangium sp.]|nr:LuxR C-terminal-related transcriptional regulator [Archangium sp.]